MNIQFAPLTKCPGINNFDCPALIDKKVRPVCRSCTTYAHLKGIDAASGQSARPGADAAPPVKRSPLRCDDSNGGSNFKQQATGAQHDH